MNVYAVAIVLGDNDFGNTMRPLLESVYRAYQFRGKMFDAEHLQEIIEEGLKFHYLAFQDYGEVARNPKTDSTVNYLLEGLTVLFNQDAVREIATQDHDKGAWFLSFVVGEVHSF